MKEHVKIEVYEGMEALHQPALERAIERRIKRAAANKAVKAKRRNIIALCCLVSAIIMSSTLMFAGNEPVVEEPPAAPVTESAQWAMTAEERDMVINAVHGVAEGESQLAKRMVAQCIIQTSKKNEVSVKETIENYRYPSKTPEGAELAATAEAVDFIADGNYAIAAEICFCPNLNDIAWTEGLSFVAQVGNLRFYA